MRRDISRNFILLEDCWLSSLERMSFHSTAVVSPSRRRESTIASRYLEAIQCGGVGVVGGGTLTNAAVGDTDDDLNAATETANTNSPSTMTHLLRSSESSGVHIRSASSYQPKITTRKSGS